MANNQIKKDGFNMENTVEIKINEDFIIRVNPYPTIEEKIAFVKAVAEGVNIDGIVYHTLIDARCITLFLAAFSDYTFPDELKNEDGAINVENAYNHIRYLDLWKLRRNPTVGAFMKQLENDINSCIEFEKQKIVALYSRNIALEETLENVNLLVDKGIGLLNGLMQKVDTFTPKSFSEIVKNIPEQFLVPSADDAIQTEA